MTEEENNRKNSLREIRKQSIEKLTTLITSAFGLVAALAWNSAIQKVFSVIYQNNGDLFAMLLYAGMVTVIAVVITIYVGRLAGKLNGK